MVLVEADLAGVELTDAALDDLEFGLRLLGLGRRVLDADRQAGHGLVDRLDAGAHGVDLSGQPRQALAAVGLGAGGGHVGAFGFGGDAFTLGEFGAGRLQPSAGLAQLVEQLALLGSDFFGLGLEGFWVGSAGSFGLRVQMLGALTGDAHGRADPFGQRR